MTTKKLTASAAKAAVFVPGGRAHIGHEAADEAIRVGALRAGCDHRWLADHGELYVDRPGDLRTGRSALTVRVR